MSYSSRPFWFYRIYCLVVACCWNIPLIASFVTGTKPKQELFYLIPLLIPAIFLIFSAAVFKFPYSAFGKLERSLSSGDEVFSDSSSGEIGFLSIKELISYFLYTDGIGFSILAVGFGFVPFSLVSEIKEHRFGGCTVVYDSPEVRSPLIINSRRFADAVMGLYWSLKQ